jgi:hypothetical protein
MRRGPFAVVASRGRLLIPLIAVLLFTGGCSAIMVRSPPRPYDPGRRPEACGTSLGPPVVDLLFALPTSALLVNSVTKARGAEAAIGTLLFGALDIAFIVSAVHGFANRNPCSELKATVSACRGGDEAACLLVDPAHQRGQPLAAPILCVRDADCGGGQQCVASSCRATPPAGPAGPAEPAAAP